MMNFTSLSLALLWNSPIYCICSNLSSYSCPSKCSELGYYYLPNEKSIFKSLRDNINREIKFVFISNTDFDTSFFISLPYFIFKDRSISFTSYSKQRINISLEIDTSDLKYEKPYYHKKIPIRTGSIKLINIDLTLSLSYTKLNDNDLNTIEFDSLSFESSSLKMHQKEKHINLKANNLFIDDDSIKIISLNNSSKANSYFDNGNNTSNNIHYLNLPFSFKELNFLLTYPSNVISFNNSWLTFSSSYIFYENEDFHQPEYFVFNISCDNIRLIQENSFQKKYPMNELNKYNISVFIDNMSIPISCDFSDVNYAYINACIKCENKTNIISTFDFNVGSNIINIYPYSSNTIESESLSSDYQFSMTENFTQSSLFNPTEIINFDFSQDLNSTETPILTESIENPEEYASQSSFDTDFSLSSSDIQNATELFTPTQILTETSSTSPATPIQTPTETPSPSPTATSSFFYEPFFYVNGNCEIFVDSVPISQFSNYIDNLKDFTIDYESLDNLSLIFKTISDSPYQTITLTIDINSEIPIIIPPSIFYRKSFHIISKTANQTVLFNNSNFSIGTFQNFTNIIINTTSQIKLNFSTLCLHKSFFSCPITCIDLVIDESSLDLQRESNNSNIETEETNEEEYFNNPTIKNIFIELPTNTEVDIYPIDRMICIKNKTYEFNHENIENIFLITDSNSSVYFDQINNETDKLSEERVNFTFVINKNKVFKESTIIFYERENITDELPFFSIDSRSAFVNVTSVGFEFTVENSIRLLGDKSVSFNSLNGLFFNSYCLCNDTNEDFNCLEVCDPKMGPILPFERDIISSTVSLVKIDYINFTIFGSNEEKNPFFDYSLFNRTSLDIQKGKKDKEGGNNDDDDDDEPAYLTIKTAEKTVTPQKNVICKLSNLCFIISSQDIDTNMLYLNFATAFISSLSFVIPTDCFLTISSVAVDTDVLTLLKFPSNLIFTSPTEMCNISCSTIITTIIILSNQQIGLASEEYNISYKLDLSLLLHMPANISCLYGTTKSEPLKILLLDDQPKSLAEIPDLRIDVSRIQGSDSYVEFPDTWNTNIEDVSSKVEIFHNDKTLYIQGKVVDDVYTTKPPTIFHNGAGFLYINGILSTFKIKYCICDGNLTDCQSLCKNIGPVIPFDQESITATIKSNPTRHITYIIISSTSNWRPYFRLSDFAVKSFTLSSDSTQQQQFIDLETTPLTPVVPLNHRFISLSIRPIAINDTADMKFRHLYIENSKFDCKNELAKDDDEIDDNDDFFLDGESSNFTYNCSLSQIDLTIDLESAYALSQAKLLSPAQSLNIIGKRTLKNVVLDSFNAIDLSTDEEVNKMAVRFNLSQLSPPGSSVSISTLLGAQNNSKSMLSVELPSHETTYDQIPNLKFDLTQIDGQHCYMLFPTSSWTGELSNLSQKIVIEYGRHDFFQESSKHENRYDGIPPIISAIGSGGYYINGVLFSNDLKFPTTKELQKPFKSLGPSAIAGIVIGSVAFVVIIVGVVVIIIQKKKSRKRSEDEQTPEMIKQVNLGLVEEFSDEGAD